MNPFVSVIVPVYNVEHYLEQCLDSIVNQTEKNIEIIVVNDASPDNSENIILKYLDKYDNFIYVRHEKNRGLNATRNTGFHKAKGEYILTVDSDDYIMPQMIEKMLLKAKENNLDCVMCEYMCLKKNKLIPVDHKFRLINSNEILDGYTAIRKFLLINDTGSLANKLFNRGIYIKSQEKMQIKMRQMKIDRIDYNEDLISNFLFFLDAERCGAIAEKLYIYRVNAQSLSKRPKPKQFQEMFFCMQEIEEIVKQNNKLNIYLLEYSAFKLRRLIIAYYRYFKLQSLEQDTDTFLKIKKMLNKNILWDTIRNPYIETKMKFVYILYRINLFRVATFIKLKIGEKF